MALLYVLQEEFLCLTTYYWNWRDTIALSQENVDDGEFNKIKDILVQRLVISALSGTELYSGWMQDVAKAASQAEGMDGLTLAIHAYTENHMRSVTKFAHPPKIELVTRAFNACEGCHVHINKGMIASVLDGRRFCVLCGLSLSILKGKRISEYLALLRTPRLDEPKKIT